MCCPLNKKDGGSEVHSQSPDTPRQDRVEMLGLQLSYRGMRILARPRTEGVRKVQKLGISGLLVFISRRNLQPPLVKTNLNS